MRKIIFEKQKHYLYFAFNSKDQEDLLTSMSHILWKYGFVKSTYQEAVIAREKIFPTGLPTKGINVAIPHTDSEHVLKEGILVGTLETPVTFGMMATEDEFVEVELVFMLAIKDPNEQLSMLQKLMILCQDEENLRLLKKGLESKKVKELLQSIK